MTSFSFDKLVIFGVGLIGGSLARALRERAGAASVGRIVGVGRSRASAERARALGVVDDAFVFTAFSAAGFVAEHVHGVVVSAPDTRSWAPPPDRRN